MLTELSAFSTCQHESEPRQIHIKWTVLIPSWEKSGHYCSGEGWEREELKKDTKRYEKLNKRRGSRFSAIAEIKFWGWSLMKYLKQISRCLRWSSALAAASYGATVCEGFICCCTFTNKCNRCGLLRQHWEEMMAHRKTGYTEKQGVIPLLLHPSLMTDPPSPISFSSLSLTIKAIWFAPHMYRNAARRHQCIGHEVDIEPEREEGVRSMVTPAKCDNEVLFLLDSELNTE